MTVETVEIDPLDVAIAVTVSHEPDDECGSFRCLHAGVQVLAESRDTQD